MMSPVAFSIALFKACAVFVPWNVRYQSISSLYKLMID